MGGDLERRRREGAAKLEEAERSKREREAEQDTERSREDDARVRLAIGNYRYGALRKLVFWAAVPGLPTFTIGLVLVCFDIVDPAWGMAVLYGGIGWMFGLMGLYGTELVWRVSRATLEAERRWIASLPFPVTGYFEWLSRYVSSGGTSLRFTVRGSGIAARREELLQLVASIHPEVRTEDDARWDGGVRFVIGGLSRDEDPRVRIVHELIDRVLVAIHHETPIAALEIRER